MKNSLALGPFLPAIALLLLLTGGLGSFAPRACTDAIKTIAKPEPLPISTGIDQHFKISVGPPAAELAVWTLEPKAGTPVRGTVLFLHGFMATHRQLQNAGEALREAGYRAVLVDLRGFGESTGDHITFGVLDSADLRQLTDALQARKLCGNTLGVYGTSYGAASAILYAAADPRVSTLIAVAPFANIRDEVPIFSRHALGSLADVLTDSALMKVAGAVSSVTGMDLDHARPIDAIQRLHAHLLLIHGDKDTIVPEKASEELHAADPASNLLVIPGQGHLDLCFDIPGMLQKPTREWFDHYLGAALPR